MKFLTQHGSGYFYGLETLITGHNLNGKNVLTAENTSTKATFLIHSVEKSRNEWPWKMKLSI